MPSRKTSERYIGRTAVLFVARLNQGSRCFRQRAVVVPLLDIMRDKLVGSGCNAKAYCFLSSELHVLIEGFSEFSRPRRAFLAFREETESWLLGNGLPGWAPTFFCREIPSLKDRETLALEVLEEPAKRALSPRMCQYPFIGSIEQASEG